MLAKRVHMAKVTVSFTLDDEQDQDLMRWLDRMPSRGRSAAIRETLRAGLSQQTVTLDDVYRKLNDIEHKLKTGIVAVPESNAMDIEEPPEITAALDALAGL
jgi:hypothetical protein